MNILLTKESKYYNFHDYFNLNINKMQHTCTNTRFDCNFECNGPILISLKNAILRVTSTKMIMIKFYIKNELVCIFNIQIYFFVYVQYQFFESILLFNTVLQLNSLTYSSSVHHTNIYE